MTRRLTLVLYFLACPAALSSSTCSTQDADNEIVKRGPSMLLQLAEHKVKTDDATPSSLHNGIAVIRVPKTGSSTFKEVVSRFGLRHGLSELNSTNVEGPFYYARHGERRFVTHKLETSMPGAFMASMVRNPQALCMSAYYHFYVSRANNTPSDESKLLYIKQKDLCAGDFMSTYLEPMTSSTAEQIMTSFNFIGVTEHCDESLLVLKKQLGLSVCDILYAKVRDSSSDCSWLGYVQETHPPLEEEPEIVQQALTATNWARDLNLLQVANDSLSSAISAYGPGFQADLDHFKSMLDTVASLCACGGVDAKCVDEVVKKHGWD